MPAALRLYWDADLLKPDEIAPQHPRLDFESSRQFRSRHQTAALEQVEECKETKGGGHANKDTENEDHICPHSPAS